MFAEPTIIEDTDTHRTCSVCLLSKTFDHFYKDGKDNYGTTRYRRDCKSCYNTTRAKARRPKPKPKPIARPQKVRKRK